MRNNLNTTLLIVAVVLLAYIAFLKPQPQRFTKTVRRSLLLDTATGRLCSPRTPSKEAIKRARLRLEFVKSLPTDAKPDRLGQNPPSNLPPLPDGFVLEQPLPELKTPLQHAEDALYNLLHPSKRYPLCSDL